VIYIHTLLQADFVWVGLNVDNPASTDSGKVKVYK
jgi:hypothetical protein